MDESSVTFQSSVSGAGKFGLGISDGTLARRHFFQTETLAMLHNHKKKWYNAMNAGCRHFLER